MKKPTTAETVAANIKMLMQKTGINAPALSKKSHVPVRTIYSIIKLERTPGIDTTDDIAKAFGLNGWHLLMPGLQYDIIKNGALDKLIEDYSHCPEKSQEYINMVAERDATYKVGNGSDEKL